MTKKASDMTNRLDRPSRFVPSVDAPWDDPEAQERRNAVRDGDQSTHRQYHTLFEDMLN